MIYSLWGTKTVNTMVRAIFDLFVCGGIRLTPQQKKEKV